MKILDKYILKKFLTTFVFVVAILMVVLVVVDMTEKNEDFIKNKPPLKEIIDYYLDFIPYYANLLSPITVFIATVFVTSQMAARTEVVAILSAGVSFNRFLIPYIIGAAIIGSFTFYAVSYLIPNANRGRIAFELKYVRQPFSYDKRNVHFKVAPDTYVSLESYNNAINTGYQFTIETIKGTEVLSKLSADRVVWVQNEKKWRLEGITLRTFVKGSISDSAKANAQKQEKLTYLRTQDTTLNMSPRDFESNYLRNETMTTPELNRFIENEQLRGVESLAPYYVERYLRVTYPFAILILTMIGVILSSRKSREGPGFQIAVGFVLAFIYIMFFVMSRSIAQAGNIDPLLACWLPNIIFTIIGAVLYKTVPR